MKMLIRNSISSILETATNALLSFGLSIFIGRFYGVDTLGVYSFVASTSAIAVAISNFGVTPYYIRRIAQSTPSWPYARKLINIRVLISVPFYFATSSLLIASMSNDWPRSDHLALLIFFGLINLNMLLASIFNSQQRNSEFFIYSLIYKLGAISSMAFTVFMSGMGFTQFIILISIGALIQVSVLMTLKIKSLNLKLRVRSLIANINAIKKTLTIGLAGVFEAIMNRIDILIIGLFLSETAMGVYSAAYSYFMIYILLSLSLTKVFFARFSFHYKNNMDRAVIFLRNYVIVSLLYSIVAAGLLYASAEVFMSIFYGEEFKLSSELARGLSFCILPMTMARLFGHVINAIGGFSYAAYIAAFGASVSIFANFILIESHQIWAPIYATFAAETIVCLISIIFFFRVKNRKNDDLKSRL